MNSTALKVAPDKPTHDSADNNMAVQHNYCSSRCSVADSSSVSSYYTNDNSRSLSRDSSFSSYSTSSTTGSSGCGCDIDSPLRKIIARSSSRKYERRDVGQKQEDRPCSRLLNSRRKLFELSRQGGLNSRNRYDDSDFYKVASLDLLDENGFPKTGSSSAERCRSEPELSLTKSLLSSPEGLIISTPHAKTTPVTERVRSWSESYDDSTEKTEEASKLTKKEKPKRRLNTSFDWNLDETGMKRVLELLEGSRTKDNTSKRDEDIEKRLDLLTKERDSALRERDAALRERDEALRDRDCYKCERDALQLERDNLIEKREDLRKELNNRSCVIEHLKEHLGLAYIPVNIDPYKTVDTSKTNDNQKHNLDVSANLKTRPRSKSEIRRPEFFVPDEIFQRSNAYTRL